MLRNIRIHLKYLVNKRFYVVLPFFCWVPNNEKENTYRERERAGSGAGKGVRVWYTQTHIHNRKWAKDKWFASVSVLFTVCVIVVVCRMLLSGEQSMFVVVNVLLWILISQNVAVGWARCFATTLCYHVSSTFSTFARPNCLYTCKIRTRWHLCSAIWIFFLKNCFKLQLNV